jgi:hypothetical protein
MMNQRPFNSVVPESPGEAGVASAAWRRVGILGRLVRVESATPADEPREVGASPPVRAA